MSREPDRRPSLPAGRPPWDPWNGSRVGALAGGVLGLILTLVTSLSNFWLVLVGGVIGAGVGYWSEKRRQGRAAKP